MAHNLVEVTTFGNLTTVPDDGDTANSASVELFAQQLANRTQTIKVRDPVEIIAQRDPTLGVNVVETLAVGVQVSSVITSPTFNNIVAGEQVLIQGHFWADATGMGNKNIYLRDIGTGIDIPGFLIISTLFEFQTISASFTYPSSGAATRIALIVNSSVSTCDLLEPFNLNVTRFNPGV